MKQSADATRATILQTAEALFVERGYDRTSMREIATAAGMSLSTLYAQFEGKDSLLRAVAAPRLTAFVTEVRRAAAAETDPLERALAVVASACSFISGDPFVNTLFTHRLTSRNLQDFVEVVIRQSEARVESLCRQLQAEGRIYGEDIPASIAMVRCAIQGWFAFEQTRSDAVPIERIVGALGSLVRLASRARALDVLGTGAQVAS